MAEEVDEEVDLGGLRVALRALRPSDSMEELTRLLHRAYAGLAAAGLNYTATTQGPEVTRRRCDAGMCLVGVLGGRLVATVTWRPPGPDRECGWFRRSGVVSFEQLAVDPDLQARGLGGVLLDRVEASALASGAVEVACDTAEPARSLVDWYVRRGYRVVDRVHWPGKSYDSVILGKRLR